MSKAPVRLSTVFREERETVEFPDGRIFPVRPVDGVGFDMFTEMEADNSKGNLIYDIAVRCLPTAPEKDVRGLEPFEAAAVVVIGMGKVKLIQRMAEAMAEKNAEAPTTAEPEPQRSSTLSDTSTSVSSETAGVA